MIAAGRDIADGDRVRLYNLQSAVAVQVALSDDLPRAVANRTVFLVVYWRSSGGA